MPTICFIDSGVGGLTILREAVKQGIPGKYIYCADRKYYPYGGLSESELSSRLVELTSKLEKLYEIDVLVLACNTASTLVLESLRAKFNFPIVGVVPAVKPAASISKTKVIGLLATEGTIKRPYTDDLIRKFCEGIEVIRIGSNHIVEMAESKILEADYEAPRTLLKQILDPFLKEKRLDTVVLACTHFPFLESEISSLLGRGVSVVDSAEAVCKRLAHILSEVSSPSHKDQGSGQHVIFMSTSESSKFYSIKKILQGFDKIEIIDLI